MKLILILAYSIVATCGSELNTNAIGWMRLKRHLMLQTGVAEDVHAAHSVCQEEQVICVVPRDLVDLKAKRLLHTDFVCSSVDKRD